MPIALPAIVSYDSTTRTATLMPLTQLAVSAAYTATVGGAVDSAGNVMAPVSWSFTTRGCPCSLWDSTATPAVPNVGDNSAIEERKPYRPLAHTSLYLLARGSGGGEGFIGVVGPVLYE